MPAEFFKKEKKGTKAAPLPREADRRILEESWRRDLVGGGQALEQPLSYMGLSPFTFKKRDT